VLSNGDVLNVCADGFARVFIQNHGRCITVEIASTDFTEMESLTFNDPELQQINILDLPDISGLTPDMQVPDRVSLIRDGTEMVMVIWSRDYQCWFKLGRDEQGKLWHEVLAQGGSFNFEWMRLRVNFQSIMFALNFHTIVIRRNFQWTIFRRPTFNGAFYVSIFRRVSLLLTFSRVFCVSIFS
jgi:hypothetical protein